MPYFTIYPMFYAVFSKILNKFYVTSYIEHSSMLLVHFPAPRTNVEKYSY